MRKSVLFMLGLLLCVGAAVSSARADSQTWYFAGTNGPVPCSSGQPCGEVNITTSGLTATITVSSLLSGYIFDTFGMNISSNVWGIGSFGGEVNSPYWGVNEQQDGWGTFGLVVHTGMNGGSHGGDCVVSGGVPGAGCTFHFVLGCTSNCLLSDFEITTSGANGSGFFAGHLANGTGITGYVGSPQIPAIPEPATLSVIGSALLTMGTLLRRRLFGPVR